VILFARGLENNKAFGELLRKLDAECTKHRLARLRVFVVYLSDKLTNVSAQDDEREDLVKKIENVQDALKLNNVVLTLAAKGDVSKYDLDDSVALTVVMYRNLRIVASHTVAATELEKSDGPALKAILGDISSKLLPKR
jgi:hypothetical protein